MPSTDDEKLRLINYLTFRIMVGPDPSEWGPEITKFIRDPRNRP